MYYSNYNLYCKYIYNKFSKYTLPVVYSAVIAKHTVFGTN